MQVSPNSKEEEFLGDCLSLINNRLVSLEARLKGPLQPSSSASNSSSSETSQSDPLASRQIASPATYKKSSNMSSSDLFKAYFSPDRKKRSRTPEDSSEGAQTKKRQIQSPVFSGAGQIAEAPSPGNPIENPDSNSMRSESQVADFFSDFLKSEGGSGFLKSSLVNSFTQKISKMNQELHQLENALKEKEKLLIYKENQILSLQNELVSKDEEIKEAKELAQKHENSAKKGKLALTRTLRELEERKRQELKAKLFNDSFRLGRVTVVRNGARFQEYWEDGKEITEIKEQLASLAKQKEAYEKQKKLLKKTEDEELATTLPLKIVLLNKEEAKFKETLEKLEIEKAIHIQESRRVAEEDSARYSKSTAEHEAWPVLHGRYLLLSLLGKGGYSEVYKAYDLLEHLDLAIKFHQLNPNWGEAIKANYIKHAIRENHIHRELKHPRIVRHYDTLEVDSNCFCTVLEYCPGEDLNMYLKRHKILPEKEAKNLMFQIFAGLKYLNEQPEKIIHYDLKPHNILLNNGEVKITDFGLSKIMDPSKTNMELTSQGVGTYWYQAPECFETGTSPPRISSKVDVWSAGVILYELLYGQKPFGHNMSQEKVLKEQVITKANTVNFPGKPNVSNECKELIRNCLNSSQDERWDVEQVFNSKYFQGK